MEPVSTRYYLETDRDADVEHRISLEALQAVLQRGLLARHLVLQRCALRPGKTAAVGADGGLRRAHEHEAQVGVDVDAHAGDAAPAHARIRRGGAAGFDRGVEAARDAVR